MREQPASYASYQDERLPGWLFWPGRHPGVVLLGTLAVLVLAWGRSLPAKDVQTDSNGDDVPLFI